MKYKTKMGLVRGGDLLAIDKKLISEIKNSVNIVDVIGEVVSLTRAGRNNIGLCPFHKEKTPSFNVIEDKQFFHCFGCGKSGDVYKFLEEYRQVSFLESVHLVAERAGIPLQDDVQQTQTKPQNPNQILIDIHKDAAKFYNAVLKTTKEGQEAKNYLAQRGLTDELIDYFNIGLSPNEPDFLYQSLAKRYDENALMASGLFNLSERTNRVYDAFQNRIMFPLTDDSGQVVAFSGRIWTKEDLENKQAKYKNTRSTALFNKSYELYHLDKARPVMSKKHEVYLMEGFMDVIAAYRAGIENAVASMGTALTPDHVRHLKRYAKKVILTYDGDNAGQNAIAKSLELLKDFNVEIVRVPEQMDPDEFIQKNSPQALANLLENNRISSTEFLIHYLKPENSDNLQAEIAYVEQISKIIAQSPSITAQNSYINMVADLLPDFDYYQVEQSVNSERLQNRSNLQLEAVKQRVTVVELPISKNISAIIKAESQLMHRLLTHDYLLNEFRNRGEFTFDTQELQALYDLLVQQGEVNSYDLAQFDDRTRQMYYRVLEENLPDEIANNEIEEIIDKRDRLLRERDLQKQSKLIRESSNLGDVDAALEALEDLIAQKRNME
ncbi:DNA primase [Streptococcus macedonicus]|uniref:DNA primase n=3 Tax=Streptococcus TaxID=1301 RepID=A0A081JGX5_STRMC|nr:DNA primase [Streptococcus macedonicus]SUN61873.1 DNA primase [Streptococcus gallolyticus]KEH52088.1 DNA primase [Streptococcus macedonicus]MBF6977410.1 DNA primase [Streptococcus macedonicus]MCW8485183.1 DNA primase [Streptococcus macedonicus]MCW8493405.1 DNA primase [Streptococcus macedonicus]